MVMRGQHRKGVRYFGPFAHAYTIRETLDLLLRTFPIRTCTNAKFDRHHRLGRPCLYAHIEKCAAPCVDDIDHDAYMQLVQELIDFLDGEHDAVIARLEERMRTASDQLEFELAARACETSSRACARRSSASRWSAPRGGLRPHRRRRRRARSERAAVLRAQGPRGGPQGSHRRQGRRRGDAGARRRVVEQLYADAWREDVPKEILVPVEPDDRELYEEFLGLNRGTKVRIRGRNAAASASCSKRRRSTRESFQRHKMRRVSDHNALARAPGPRRKRHSVCPRRRCASSASTSRTSRAPRSSRRWWSWKTACPSDPTTAASR